MNRKPYERILALVSIFLVFGFLAACGSSSKPITITATSGSGQNASVTTAFAAPLVATAMSGTAPASGVKVTFTAPSSGASGTFANGTATDTETTDSNGIATSTTFTANSTVGAYTVTASASGGTGSASFNLTNTALPSYAFYLSGYEAINGGFNFYALAGAVTIDINGNVHAGEQDYNDAFGLTSPQPSGDAITGGTLTVDATGQGTLTLVTNNASLGVSGTETLGVQFVNANHALIIQFDGSATSSGNLDLQTPSGNGGGFAFTLTGVDDSYFPVAFGGVFSVSSGTISNGVVDVNDDGSVIAGTAFSGTTSAPDAFGRGTVTGLSNPVTGLPLALNYYIVGPEAIRLINVDASQSAIGSAFGQGASAGSFSAASLGSSVFGVEANWDGFVYATAGMFTTDGVSAFAGVGDDDEEGVVVSGSTISGNYAIASNGYGSLNITNAGLMDVSILGIYMTDPSLNLSDPNNASGGGGALVLDLDATLTSGTGVVVPQTDTSTASFTGNYAFGAQDFWGCSGVCEFDFVGVGPVSGLDLTGNGLFSDPNQNFGNGTTFTGAGFSGTATPDPANVGRYTIPLTITTAVGSPGFSVAIYQASGGQLFWVDGDAASLWLGPVEQQGSLNGVPAARKAARKNESRR